MRIAVCDDEKKIREMVAGRVRKLYPGAEVLSYGSGEALLSADPPDILLLDIQMPGMGGMETARELRRRERTARTPYGKTILIFLTALEEYVFDAFDVGAFHYLVKPFREEKLASVLENAAAQYREQQRGFRRTAEGAGRPLMVLSGDVHVKVLLEDIVYAEVFNRKVILHKTDEDIEYYGKLSKLAEQAGEDFFRTHRAYLVHFKYVVKYDTSSVWLERGKALMAKQNYPEFVKQFHRYNRREGSGVKW